MALVVQKLLQLREYNTTRPKLKKNWDNSPRRNRRNLPAICKRAAFLGIVAMTSIGGPVSAQQSRLAIIGVRLNMSAEEVLTTLYAQGVAPDGVAEQVHPCARHIEASCTGSMVTDLVDGSITIRFTDSPPGFNDGREAALSIVYRLTAGPNNLASMQDAAEERFGRSAGNSGAWCTPPASAASIVPCPENAARMTFHQNANEYGELTLTDFGLPARLAAGAPH